MPLSTGGRPIVFESINATTFLQHITRYHTEPSTIIVCLSREEFLKRLLAECQESDVDEFSHLEEYRHPLLIPTIQLLATSRTINLAYMPTLMHLRAYLAGYLTPERSTSPAAVYDKPGMNVRILAMVNLLHLHKQTDDFSAQSLSRTLALAVDTATQHNMNLVVAEFPVAPEAKGIEPDDIPSTTNPWTEQLPLLNSRVHYGGDDRTWTGRTVQVRRVMEAWFEFERLDLQDGQMSS